MQEQFGTVVSIVGFYLSLISILGSLFFIHLGNWYKDISTTEQKWKRYRTSNARDKHIECYLEAFDEKSPVAAIGFTLLTMFMLVLGFFSIQLRQFTSSEGSLASFLYVPMYLFFTLYCVASLIYLVRGYRKVRRLFGEIDEKISPKAG
jgi:hypothetical protein